MNNSHTSRKLRSFYVLILFLLAFSGLGFGVWGLTTGTTSTNDQSPKPRDHFFSSLQPTLMATAPMLQAGGCTGFSFTYARGFAPDPATQQRPISVVSGDFNKDGK